MRNPATSSVLLCFVLSLVACSPTAPNRTPDPTTPAPQQGASWPEPQAFTDLSADPRTREVDLVAEPYRAW